MRPSDSTGANTPGADRLARIAVVRSPRSMTTRSPVTMSVAMARNGMARSSKLCDLRHGQRQPAQDLRELLSLHQSARQAEFAALEARAEISPGSSGPRACGGN